MTHELSEKVRLFGEGQKYGKSCKNHPDQAIQEKWNETVLGGLWNYSQFNFWKTGYLNTKKWN